MNHRRWRGLLSVWVAGSALAGIYACGSTSTSKSSFDAGGDARSAVEGGPHDARAPDATRAREGGPPLGSDSSTGPSPDGSFGLGDAGVDGACASSHTPATVIPAYLVFVMDRSDSMKQFDKFPACSAALEAFFSDPSTAGIYSSLTFMPYVAPDASDTATHPGYSCVASDYEQPSVPITALPSSAFAPVIQAETLKLGTPTTPALKGALTYAKTLQAAHPNAKVRIVLATDGYPAGCTGNTVPDVAAAAAIAASTDGIPVYVIGVGPADAGLANLNLVAEAGATKSAFFIPTEVDGGDASVTTQGFLSAVHAIQGTLGCQYALPSPPVGQQLDFNEVNVVVRTNGTDATLVYSADCSMPSGWHYGTDDAGTPNDIILCPSTCQSLSSTSTTSSVSVVLGCSTSGNPPK